ncbi:MULTISPECIES: alpha/beta fold hydrolase [unclassified Butyrivibrio]|uniref:alpha/beta fold hydrolase n=1 Tax=unclassified Butyrivibrio TaxID=2639466 RepID=UPI0003B59170|nr:MULTISPECIES: alpha/beta hydrolase [unclassified Butyrivibrio]MDC7292334.1 alpha/beta hydrolase [Butyrivibrio sp. DSM 10294]
MPYNANDFPVRLEDGKVTVISFGTGDKPLVMIPGLRFASIDGGAQPLSWYYRIFGRSYRIYVIDRKFPPATGCTIHDLAEDVKKVLDKLGLSSVYLFGASQGGMIAQDLTINHPEYVKKLVLGVTASRPNDTMKAVIGGWIKLAQAGRFRDIVKDYLEKGYSEQYMKKYRIALPLLLKTQRFMPKESFITLAKACLSVDTYDKLDSIKCPVLVLGGSEDKIVTGEASAEIARKLGCEVHIYKGLSHEAYNEARDFNKRIFDFYNK